MAFRRRRRRFRPRRGSFGNRTFRRRGGIRF